MTNLRFKPPCHLKLYMDASWRRVGTVDFAHDDLPPELVDAGEVLSKTLEGKIVLMLMVYPKDRGGHTVERFVLVKEIDHMLEQYCEWWRQSFEGFSGGSESSYLELINDYLRKYMRANLRIQR